SSPSGSTTRTPGPTSTARSGSVGRCSRSTRRSASGSCPDVRWINWRKKKAADARAVRRRRRENRTDGPPIGSGEAALSSGAGHQALDDDGEVAADIGQAVEIVLALAARGDDPAVSEQGQVVADRRLALAELRAEGSDVLLAVGEDQDHLEASRVADVLEEDR